MAAEDKSKLPATYAKAAATGVGSGSGGGSYLKVCDRTGAVTFGPSRDPLPMKHRFAVNLRSFSHGYITFGNGE